MSNYEADPEGIVGGTVPPTAGTVTDAMYLKWLLDPSAEVVVLVEAWPLINGVPTLITMGTSTFPRAATGAPGQLHYPGIATISSPFSESMALMGGVGKLAAGVIEIANPNGERDAWLNYIWSNCPVKVFWGDPFWSRADMRQMFDGQAASNLDSRARSVLNIKLRDKMDRLNTPVTELKLGGATTNKDEILPLPLGEVFNMTPLLESEGTLKYRVSRGSVKQIREVRESGVPVGFTESAATGSFTLTQSPAGPITCSVEGDNVGGYVDTVAEVIERLATSYGNADTRFTAAEIDRTNFDAFNAANPQLVGWLVSDRENVGTTIQTIASALDAQVVPSRLGKLRILQIDLTDTGTIPTLPESWMFTETLQIVERPEVMPAVKLGCCKNWTVQKDLQTSLLPAHLDMMATEFLPATSVDETIRGLYKLSGDGEQRNTALMIKAEANTEALRLRELYKMQRTVLEFVGRAPCMQFELGSKVRLFASRFSLSAGKVGMVIGFEPDLQGRRVKMRVLV